MLTAYQYNSQTGTMGPNLGAVGFGAAPDPDVVRLQKALIALAAKFPSANPGAADGVIGDKTLAAVATALSTVPNIPSYIKTAFQVMNVSMALSSTVKDKAKKMVAEYAKQLAMGIEAYVVMAGAAPSSNAQDTSTTSTQKFPAGSIQWQNKLLTWTVAIPKGTMLSGHPGLGAYVHGFGLGAHVHGFGLGNAALGNSGFGETHVVATTSATAVPEVRVVSESEGKRATTPFHKTLWFWAAVAGGVATIGTGTYLVFRRK
jgi:hypothetical protein